MKKLKYYAAVACMCPVLVSCGGHGSTNSSVADETKDTLIFAAVPAETSQTLKSSYENLAKLIEQETQVHVEFQDATDYAAVIEGQRAGKIDIASYGPFSYVLAKDSGVPIEPIAAPTNDEAQAPAYTSLAYVKQDSPISSLKDLKGKKVCLVDPSSTSGYLVPMKGFMDSGIDMLNDVEPIITGGHDASLLALKGGDCDAAFAHDAMLTTLTKTGQIKEGEVKSIWESDPITEDPIAINTESVPAELVAKIRTAIREKANKPALVAAGICSSVERCVLPEEIEWGYKEISDADFDTIRSICATTKAQACAAIS
ncbi:phosphate/phosphite/phosphonate ABC transporter substrate-binding protein [Corynebacterium sp. sy017]|uniref:phosphate/phosphite/phosphonate ABC transporter substrate-binding protein n=1 Tax=unclassified Corynebacterium TaxID=2624378 RepID=UPI0011868B33|nr:MULTISPECIES: phosphate/phosphite/phosphonate ABC transporter substrate-binding protein [unclassified Corynebacterium]MBP3087902.1 phosphate/phosphite/phosphonate ABC transporter substrate-binding protein [Corynebacterium sp. sy017]TSD92443.1 phosphate/phosphite/phosphonate ABC transporter substrate-binding protein [Corynebacterium sp. SY003]